MTIPQSRIPLAAKTLQIIGYDTNPINSTEIQDTTLHIQKLSSSAIVP